MASFSALLAAANDPSAQELADLDRRQADTTSRTEHEQRFPGSEMPSVRESKVRRAIGNGKRGRCHEIHGVGNRRDDRARHDDLFRVPPSPPRKRQHAIAGANVLHTGCAFEHDAGNLQAGNERQLGFDLVFPLHHQDVGKVDAGSAHADAHLSRPEGWARHLRDLEAANAVQRTAEKCAHDHAPAVSSRKSLHAAVASAAITLSSRRISLPVDVSGNVSQACTRSGTL